MADSVRSSISCLVSIFAVALGRIPSLMALRKPLPMSVAVTDAHPSSKDISKGGTKKLAAVVDSVWEWAAICVKQCPVQPVAHLGEGLAYENPPAFIVEAHKQSLDLVECNQYSPTGGLSRFTGTLSRVYSSIYQKTLNPDLEISVHSGGTEAILSVITAFVEPDDEVIVFEPAFDLYELHVRFVGGVLRTVPLHPPQHAGTAVSQAGEWRFKTEELEQAISPRTRLLIVNTPHNPLGKVFSAAELLTIGTLCARHNIIILADEVYEHLSFNAPLPRIATLNPTIARHTISIGSIGKAFNATGWRVGYAIGDRDLIRHVKNAHIILCYTTAGPAQVAAAMGLEEAERVGFWDENRQRIKGKIDGLCAVFDDVGLPYVVPSGAHYLMVNATSIKVPAQYVFPENLADKPQDWRLSWMLLQEFGVASIPVSASFSNANGRLGGDYLRFVVSKPQAELDLAKERLRGLKDYL
ncbi:MAG: hypothetical protein HETSPECPRED_001118 [Heterodermia speciosa]|uniref:Aminotransferase class I/classII large domain-containing protein n=1 Tax=Heterodermia speciosa TaxID=116794 RepID=A0A8H3J0R8_9LECA|nr:MAG: hypothetical protein HETSPECPRED_001118 [Heterodermia speciosa]